MNAAGLTLLPIAAPAPLPTESAGLPVDSAEAGAFMALLVQAMPQPVPHDAALPMILLEVDGGNLPLPMIEAIEWTPDPETLDIPEMLFDPVPVLLPADELACEEGETPLLVFSEAVTPLIDAPVSPPAPMAIALPVLPRSPELAWPHGTTPKRSPSPFPPALPSKPFPPRAVPTEMPSPRAVRSETPPPRVVPSELPSARAAAPPVPKTSARASEAAPPQASAPARSTKREADEQMPESDPVCSPPAIVLPEVAVPLVGGGLQVRVTHPEIPLVRRPSTDREWLAPAPQDPPKAPVTPATPAIAALPALQALQALSTLRALREMSGPAAPVLPEVRIEQESSPDSPPPIAEKPSATIKAVELMLDGMLALTEQSRSATDRPALRDARPEFQPAAHTPEKGRVIKELVVAVSEEAPAPARRHAASAPVVADPVVSVPSAAAQPAAFDSASRERAGSDSFTTADTSNTAPPASPRKPLVAAPGSHVTLEVENGGDERARIRVSVQGGIVRATVLSSAELGTRLSDHVDELRRALADRGFHETTLTLQRAEPPAATATLPERDGGNHQGGRQSKNRDDNPYYGPRHKPADDRPRQHRRPEPEEKE